MVLAGINAERRSPGAQTAAAPLPETRDYVGKVAGCFSGRKGLPTARAYFDGESSTAHNLTGPRPELRT